MGYEPYEFVAASTTRITCRSTVVRRAVRDLFDEICDIKAAAQTDDMTRPFYPMIIFRTPKLDLPEVHRRQEDRGSWRSHQVPLASARDTEAHFEVLKNWLEPTSRKSCSTRTAP